MTLVVFAENRYSISPVTCVLCAFFTHLALNCLLLVEPLQPECFSPSSLLTTTFGWDVGGKSPNKPSVPKFLPPCLPLS